jgi:MoaD family protein
VRSPETPSALCNLAVPMGVTVKIPTQLRSVTGGDGETTVDGATTVGEVLDGLYDRYDGLRDRIAVDGDLRRFVNVYVGGEDIRFLDGLDTPVEDGDEVTILPAVAGGS